MTPVLNPLIFDLTISFMPPHIILGAAFATEYRRLDHNDKQKNVAAFPQIFTKSSPAFSAPSF
jgi:hypothetical protein